MQEETLWEATHLLVYANYRAIWHIQKKDNGPALSKLPSLFWIYLHLVRGFHHFPVLRLPSLKPV